MCKISLPQRIKDLNEDFCGMDVNTPLGGEQPVEGLATLTFPTRLTAVAATSTEVYTVVFLGTAQGHLKKVGGQLWPLLGRLLNEEVTCKDFVSIRLSQGRILMLTL